MKRLVIWLTWLCVASSVFWAAHSQAQTTSSLTLMSIAGLPSAELANRIMSAAYTKLGISIDIVPQPANRALSMAVSGEADGDMMRIAALDGRYSSLVQVPYPLLHGELRAITQDPSITHWDLAALADKRIAIRRGVVIAERATAGLRVTAIADSAQFIPMLERNRVDVLVISNIAGIDPLENADWSQLMVLDEVLAHFTLHHYLHRRHAELAQPLADILAQMQLSGETEAITSQFLKEIGQRESWLESAGVR
ncbi:transporter substrate-binding domain-containing protein [Saccharospirillum sp. HFRX-1]|uniref:substrate-binding periplasmic protein n=1 Tax=unclassified Saccharospirillum TaxID=2633430 RepID=UPI0037191A7B